MPVGKFGDEGSGHITKMFLAGLIMKEVVKTKQGMVSSLTILVRFAPLTFGIAVFNIIFLWGIATIVTHLSPIDM